jgi:hypothetical protein
VTGNKVTLVLDDNDVGQIVDGLTERLGDWRYTARYFEDGLVDPERSFLECTDSDEANAIADHYEKILSEIARQRSQRR